MVILGPAVSLSNPPAVSLSNPSKGHFDSELSRGAQGFQSG